MIIRIEAESDIPIYQQISNQIIEGIAKGLILPGDSLPSVRSFSADLGVNMHTVNKSYHQLEEKGIIRIAPKSGAVISSPQDFNEESLRRLKAEYQLLLSESFVVGMTEKQIHELFTSIMRELKNSNQNLK